MSALSLHLARFRLIARLWLHRRSQERRTFDVIDISFIVVLACSVLALLFMVSEMSISHKELIRLNNSHSWLFVWLRWCLEHMGKNDYVLRASFIIIHSANMLLIYMIGRIYLRKARDSLFLIIIYALLPGVNLAALLLYESGFIIFALLAICYIELAYKRTPYVLIACIGMLDVVFCVLFLALGTQGILQRQGKKLAFALLGFMLNMLLHSSSIKGVPQAYFLDVLGAFAMLFSPLLFLYYIYTLYAALTRRKEHSLLVLISACGIVFSILLSMRQEIRISSFAPLCVIGLPVLVYGFYNDMRARLPIYRTRFKVRMACVFSVLCLESACLFGNKLSYIFSQQANFARPYYIAKDVATALKQQGITHITTQNSALALRLGFYGIEEGKGACLYDDAKSLTQESKQIAIIYAWHIVVRYQLVRHHACRI